MQREIHTPEGMRDVCGNECRRKKIIQNRLLSEFYKFGYEDIETPIIEYFDVFSKEVGTIPSRDLYKFFDRVGDTLVLRPDFTPSIARAVSMYYADEKMPVRLCYQGKTFVNSSSYQGRLNESTQVGVEYLGDDSVMADAELIALSIHALKSAGLKEFQISIGEVNYFKALVEEAGLDEETVALLRKRISNKNTFGVDELLDQAQVGGTLREAFRQLPSLFGSEEILYQAAKLTDNARAEKSIERLSRIYDVLKMYHMEEYVSFDLSMLSKYRYYTGIIFQGFTYGVGEPVLKGGRYDQLMEHFDSVSMPAVGFGLTVEFLINALERQGIPVSANEKKAMVVYAKDRLEEALKLASEMRNQGMYVSMAAKSVKFSPEDYQVMADEKQAELVLCI